MRTQHASVYDEVLATPGAAQGVVLVVALLSLLVLCCVRLRPMVPAKRA